MSVDIAHLSYRLKHDDEIAPLQQSKFEIITLKWTTICATVFGLSSTSTQTSETCRLRIFHRGELKVAGTISAMPKRTHIYTINRCANQVFSELETESSEELAYNECLFVVNDGSLIYFFSPTLFSAELKSNSINEQFTLSQVDYLKHVDIIHDCISFHTMGDDDVDSAIYGRCLAILNA